MKKSHFKLFILAQFVIVSAFTIAHAIQYDNPVNASHNGLHNPINASHNGLHNPINASRNGLYNPIN
ncbi:MAG: hypothetical protein ACRYGR_06435 [Janthinobacterium lividum]